MRVRGASVTLGISDAPRQRGASVALVLGLEVILSGGTVGAVIAPAVLSPPTAAAAYQPSLTPVSAGPVTVPAVLTPPTASAPISLILSGASAGPVVAPAVLTSPSADPALPPLILTALDAGPVVVPPVFSGPTAGGTIAPWRPPGPSTAPGFLWEIGFDASGDRSAGWRLRGSVSGLTTTPWSTQDPIAGGIGLRWRQGRTIEGDTSTPWGTADLIDADVLFPWRTIPQREGKLETPWGIAEAITGTIQLPWHGIAPIPHSIVTPWGIGDQVSITLTGPWAQPPQRDVYPGLPWGIGDPVSSLLYVPRPFVPIIPPAPLGWTKGKAVTLRFWKERYSGDRIVLRFGELPFLYGREIVVNTASVVRLPDLAPIPCSAVGVSLDDGSWGWSFRATVLGQSALDLIKPAEDGTLTDLLVTLNGWQWVVTVQSWDRSREFGNNTWSISAFSSSAKLAQPYAAPRAKVQDNARTAQQLADEEVDGTGWTVNWGIDDWTVPAGVWSYGAKTPLAAVIDIAAAAGAEVTAHRTDQVLLVRPRYPVPLWDWDTETPDKTISDSQSIKEGVTWEARPVYDAVFCVGDRDGGVVVKATREDTAGGNVAPDFTHPLMTDSIAARQKATEVFCWSGAKQTFTRVLPLYTSSYPPGLLDRGMLVDIAGVRGLVRSVRIEAARAQAGNKVALVITQTVTVEVAG